MVALLIASLSMLGPDTWELNAYMTKMGYKKEKESSVVLGTRLDFVRLSYAEEIGGGQEGTVSTKQVRPRPQPTVRNEVKFLASPERLSKEPDWGSMKHTQHLEPVYLGIKDGYHIYAMAPIPESLSIQKQLKLQGGVDWQWLAAKGTIIQDKGTSTANSCVTLFSEGDDRGLQFLMGFASQEPKKSWHAILGIGHIPTSAATDQLISLYRSNSPEYRQAAAYALIYPNLRKAAKAEYIDMIAQGTYVGTAAKAAANWKWEEAIPALQIAIDKPQYISDLIAALEAIRSLRGTPVPSEVLESSKAFVEAPAEVARIKSVLISHSDKELVSAYAYRFMTIRSKVKTDNLNHMGQELLEAMPSSDRESLLAKLKKGN